MIHESVRVPSSRGAQIRMDVYVPNASREIEPDIRRPAIVICPGGGYRYCSEREAEPVALRFLMEGFNTFVLWYRVNSGDGSGARDHEAANWYSASPEHTWPLPQHDAAAAVAYVRRHADEWHTDPDKIAIMGFSAGGHVAASVSALWHRPDMWQELGLAPEEVRPNAAVLCYPVIAADKDAHRDSFTLLTGQKDEEKHQAYSVLNWVSEDFPPAFLWHTFDDATVPVQNSMRLGLALAEKGVTTEMHIFPKGRHGLSLSSAATAAHDDETRQVPECRTWPQMAARFLRNL